MSRQARQFFVFPDLPPDSADTIIQINQSLARLYFGRRPEIAVTGRLARSKIAWKIETFCEAMLYRIVALAEGAALCWNEENMLGAVLSARAIVETSAVLFDYEHQLVQMLRSNDLEAINAITMNRMFSSRDTEWVKESPDLQAVNVLTLIDKMDARLLPGARGHYDRLSERCHPNSFGQHQMFTRTDYKTRTVAFSDGRTLRDTSSIVCGLLLLPLLENILKRVSELTEQVAELHYQTRSPDRR